MKKSLYITSIILTITLTACGSSSLETQATETSLSETAGASDTESQTTVGNTGAEPQATSGNTDAEPQATSGNADAKPQAIARNADAYNKTAASKTEENELTPKTDSNNADALPEYTVTTFEESKPMYASTSVNVRKGPSTDFEIVGGLKSGQEVTATGQADTMWYEIQYGKEKAFVSNEYLQDEKSEDAAPELVAEGKNAAGVILVGDSRFVQMKNCVGENSCTWIAESSKGYKWFNEKAIARIDSCVAQDSKILINLGVNDIGNLQKYISLINAKADEWVEKGATVYYASVNPVCENLYVTEEQVESFNSQMQSSLSDNVHWIDSHSYLISIGYDLVDGLHYSSETYQNLYAYYMSCI